MKIIQVNASYGYGSTGMIVKEIQAACEKQQIECIVAYSISSGIVHNGYCLGNWLSNKIHAVLTRICGMQGYFSVLPTFIFIRFLKKFNPDIIHLHNLHSNYVNLPMLLNYAHKENIPVVVTLHDCWFFTGGCSHYTNARCNKWQKQCGNCPQRYVGIPALLWDGSSMVINDKKQRFGSIANLTAVGVSQWITEESKLGAFNNARCVTIRNGIDTTFLQPVKSDFFKEYNLDDKFIILAPSNKWFLDVNRETLSYFAQHLLDDMRMVFFGDGFDEGLMTDKMVNIGFISSRQKIREIFSSADVLVNCTREESLSLLNLEVQSCGTPVVTYSNTGVKETVNGVCGFAVENGRPELAWEAMINIKKKGKEFYSQSCRKWIIEEFNKKDKYQQYVKLYHSILM